MTHRSHRRRLRLTALEDRCTPAGLAAVAVAPAADGPPVIQLLDGTTGAVRLEVPVLSPDFRGEVRTALGDVDGDAVADVIAAAGPGGGPVVQVFSGVDGRLLKSFFAYAESFTGGVSVAAGDTDGDGKAEIFTAAGAGGGPHVKVFDAATLAEKQSFFAYAADFTGGVSVACGDVNGDGRADVITGAGAGGGPHVKEFSGASGAELRSFYAFAPTFAGGVFVAGG